MEAEENSSESPTFVYYILPKERFTATLKIRPLIRMGILKCSECDRGWDEEEVIPLQDECGHLKCRPCFSKCLDDPCPQCVSRVRMISPSTKLMTSTTEPRDNEDQEGSKEQGSADLANASSSVAVDGAEGNNNVEMKTSGSKGSKVTAGEKEGVTLARTPTLRGQEHVQISNNNYETIIIKGRTFPCEQCPARFETEAELQRHVPLHLVLRDFLFKCKVCSEVFWKKNDLQSHMVWRHVELLKRPGTDVSDHGKRDSKKSRTTTTTPTTATQQQISPLFLGGKKKSTKGTKSAPAISTTSNNTTTTEGLNDDVVVADDVAVDISKNDIVGSLPHRLLLSRRIKRSRYAK